MKNRVIEFIKKHNLQDKTIIVGCSGGYDSMSLVNILSDICDIDEFKNLTVVVAHFNHNWRGEEALKEQEVCRYFAASKGFEFYTKTASEPLKKTENEARIARYEFFEDAVDIYDADAVFTAHNKDDNAETVLYRVVKGTGIYGLKGIAEKRGIYYRPFLKISRDEILEYCKINNLDPNNDSSNQDTIHNRNYLRLEIIPALKRINYAVQDALNTLSEVAQSEENILEEYLSKFRCEVFKNDTIVSSEYKKLSKDVKKRFLLEYIQKFDLDYDYKKICEIYEFVEQNISMRNGTTMSLATALWLYVDDKIIETIPKKKTEEHIEVDIDIYGEGIYIIGNKTLEIKKYIDKELFVFPDSAANFVYVDLSDTSFPLKMRTRKDGDIINPFGMEGSMKFKKYLNAKGVSRYLRDEVLLLADENEILWAVGIGLSNKIGVKTRPTHVIELK